jgi:hypothetical protein
MAINLDNIEFTSTNQPLLNRQKLTAQLTIGGTVPAGGQLVEVAVPIARNNSIAEVYLTKQGGNKRLADSSLRVNDYVGSSNAFVYVNYAPNSTVNIAMRVNGTGTSYVTATQVYDFEIFLFDPPI